MIDDVPQEQLDIQREMAFTDWEASCQAPHVTPKGELRECRRQKRHAPPHASGFGNRHQQWFDLP